MTTVSIDELRERVAAAGGLGRLTAERLRGETVRELAEDAVALARLLGGDQWAARVQTRLGDALAAWVIDDTRGSVMDVREMRRQACRDGGVPVTVADEMLAETQAVAADEIVAWTRARRGEAGVADVRRRFAEADARELPDELRRRVADDLGLTFDQRAELLADTAAADERSAVSAGLGLLQRDGGSEAVERGQQALRGRAMDGLIRERARGDLPLAGAADIDNTIRAAAGRAAGD